MARSFARMAVDQPEQAGQSAAGTAAAAAPRDHVPDAAGSHAQVIAKTTFLSGIIHTQDSNSDNRMNMLTDEVHCQL